MAANLVDEHEPLAAKCREPSSPPSKAARRGEAAVFRCPGQVERSVSGKRGPPPRWSSSAARAHAVVVSVLTPAEVLIAARRLAGAQPHLAAVAAIVHPEDLWQVCRGELTGLDVRIDGWDIRGRWFGVVVGATPRLGSCRVARRSHGG